MEDSLKCFFKGNPQQLQSNRNQDVLPVFKDRHTSMELRSPEIHPYIYSNYLQQQWSDCQFNGEKSLTNGAGTTRNPQAEFKLVPVTTPHKNGFKMYQKSKYRT